VDLLFSTEAGSDDLTIGSYAEANACIPVGLPFNGDVDEVEIFNRALSDGSDDPADNEIWDLYTKGKCKDGGVEPSIVKEKLSGPDMVGIYTTSATEFSFEITYTNDVQEFAVRILDTVPAEFAVFSLTKTDGTASSFATGKGNKSSATRIEWDIPADTDCSAGCTLTVAVETVPSSGGRGIYKPTSCGTLSLNNGATAYEVDPSTLEIKLEMNLVSGILEPVIVLGPSNPLEVEAVGDPADGATKPCAPENLTATLDGNNIALDWDDNAEADAIAHYNVYRSIDGARFRVVEMVQQSMYADTNLQPGEYCYQVKAEFFDGSEGNEAGEICETIPEPVL
jgi:hypothetical protein